MLEVAICDDDKEDLDKAALMLDKILSEYQVQYQIRSFLSANELLNNNDKIDIGILDISMEELGGITLGRKLKEKNHDIKIIYITSYEEYYGQELKNDYYATENKSYLDSMVLDEDDEKYEKSIMSDTQTKNENNYDKILDDIVKGTYAEGTKERQVQDFYKSCTCLSFVPSAYVPFTKTMRTITLLRGVSKELY